METDTSTVCGHSEWDVIDGHCFECSRNVPVTHSRWSRVKAVAHAHGSTAVVAVVSLMIGVLGTLTYDNFNDYRIVKACPDDTVATYSVDRGDWSRCVSPWTAKQDAGVTR